MKALKILSLFVVALMLCIVFAACDEQPTETVHQHTVVIDEAVAPTCENTGLTEGSHCSECGEILVKQESVNKLEHAPVVDAAVDATCSREGLTEGSHCSKCGEILVKQESVDKLEHTPVVDAAVDATCSQTGLTEGSHCSECGEVLVKQEVVSKIDHTIVIDKAVESTCTSTGLTEGKHCSECKEILVPQQEVSLQEHTYDDRYDALCNVCGYERDADCPHLELETIDGKPATCVLQGISDGKKCVKCGELIVGQKVIAALGHKEVIDAAKAPTCSEIGLTEGKHCSVCNEIIVPQTPIDTLKHTEVIDEAKAPTCTETGLTEGKHCSVCNTIVVAQVEISALGHTEVIDKGKSPTCTEKGLTDGKHCSVCNTIVVAQVEISALGHTEVIDKGKAPTCTEKGLTDGKHCSVCNTSIVVQVEISALGHTEVIDKGKEPTTTETGLTDGKHCSVCNEILVAQQVIRPIGHTHTYERPDFDLGTLIPTLTDCVADAVTGVITPGKDTYVVTCDDCGMTGTIVEEHTIIVGIVVAPTCYQNGYTYDYCEICNRKFNKRNEMKPDASAHDWIRDESEALAFDHPEWYGIELLPTCVTPGIAYTTCKICGATTQMSIPAFGHFEVILQAKVPTATEAGLTEGKYCSVCNEILVPQQVIPALGHKHTYYDAQGNLIGGELDCLNGVMIYTCASCPAEAVGAVLEVAIEGFDFNDIRFHKDYDKQSGTWNGVWDYVAEADCNTAGVYLYSCSGHDGRGIIVNTGPKHNIDMNTYIPAVAPTATTPGHVGFEECIDCDYEKGIYGEAGIIDKLS